MFQFPGGMLKKNIFLNCFFQDEFTFKKNVKKGLLIWSINTYENYYLKVAAFNFGMV